MLLPASFVRNVTAILNDKAVEGQRGVCKCDWFHQEIGNEGNFKKKYGLFKITKLRSKYR